ncbi:unnamed protein product [Spirodela intermedia]|uniref:Uncharacterized protein n=1 Tax=Spirodela intermedia TaxID=51605 RepID=A0A7I8JT95_SPIIN|nr:unnamed protein product [Spirodela intermedia]CAA6673400.1 unnamed protein product [Spirodela intermedia]
MAPPSTPELAAGEVTSAAWMVERAAEELRALEDHHPHRFGCIKLELMAFITGSSPPSAAPVATQESSNRKRKAAPGTPPPRRWRAAGGGAQAVLARAEECLRKIRRVKELLIAGG